jgi:hypothetical protein
MSDHTELPANNLRRLILDNLPNLECKIIELSGQRFELREPTLEQFADIHTEMENEDDYRASVSALMIMTHDPDTGKRVFEETDRQIILSSPIGSAPAQLVREVQKYIGELAEKKL